MDVTEVFELLDIEWHLKYELPESQLSSLYVKDGNDETVSSIEYDAEGIPLGQGIEEIRIRQKMIGDFFRLWKETHDQHEIFNQDLKENILVRSISVIEACQHSAKSYISTKAAFMFETILREAKKVSTTKPKVGNKNQQNFSDMLILVFESEELGTVRLTVGVRKRTGDKIQYGISARQQEKGTSN